MRRLLKSARVSILLLSIAAHAIAGNWILTLRNPSNLSALSQQFGLNVQATLHGPNNVYLVSLPSGALESLIVAGLRALPVVNTVTPDSPLSLPEKDNHSQDRTFAKSTGRCTVKDASLTPGQYYWVQPAVCLVDLPAAGTSGVGIEIALIDTWVDFTHPVLAGAIDMAHSRNFRTAVTGGVPLTQETSPMVDQETSPMVDGSGTIILNQETSPMVDQETSPMVDAQDPAYFGHGTGVAGILHLTAPAAQIAAMEVFDTSTGSGSLSAIVAAIYYAVDTAKAQVINMSFSMPASLDANGDLQRAIAYATAQGAVVVASVPDSPATGPVYPANMANVTAVGCTDGFNKVCDFSGPLNSPNGVYAPGYQVVSPYPGRKYALYTGTSFSAPWVSGTGALLAPYLWSDPAAGRSAAVTQSVQNSGQKNKGVVDAGVAVANARQ